MIDSQKVACPSCSRLSSENSFYAEKIETLVKLNEQLRAENYKLRSQSAPKPVLTSSIFSSLGSFIKSPTKLFQSARFFIYFALVYSFH